MKRLLKGSFLFQQGGVPRHLSAGFKGEIWLYDGTDKRRIEVADLRHIDLDVADLRVLKGPGRLLFDDTRALDRSDLAVLRLLQLRELTARKQPVLIRPPGYHLGEWLRVIVGRKAYEDYLEQHLKDHVSDWREAHEANRLRVATWIKMRCVLVMVWCLVIQLPLEKAFAFFGGTDE